MDDSKIIELFFERNEKAINETENKIIALDYERASLLQKLRKTEESITEEKIALSGEELEAAFRPETKLVFGETIANPALTVLDIERFANAADFSFIFTGAIDEAVAIPLIEKYIGGLPTGGKKEKYVDAKLDFQKGQIKNVFDKQMATPSATVYLVYTGKAKYNLKNNLMMSLTKQILDIIYTEEIREKEGGTYGVGTSGSINRIPKESARMIVMFQTAPELREKLTGMAVDLLHKYAEEGPRQKDLDKVREYMLKKYTENQKENSYWASLLQNNITAGYEGYTDYEKTLNSITTDDLKKFAKSILKQGNKIEVSMVGVE